METFSVNIEVGDLFGREYRKLNAMVDTGATHTVIPRNILNNLEMRPIDVVPFELADDDGLSLKLAKLGFAWTSEGELCL